MSRKHARQRPQPPMRDGISASCVVLPATSLQAGDMAQALAIRLPGLSAQAWRTRLEQGLVLDAALQPVHVDTVPKAQMALWYYRQLEHAEPPVPYEQTVVFEDDRLVVVDKPHFLPVSPKGRHLRQTALVRLKQTLGLADLVPMHRLDRETAGLLLFTKRPQDRHIYQSLFAHRQVHKMYWAVVALGPGRWQALDDTSGSGNDACAASQIASVDNPQGWATDRSSTAMAMATPPIHAMLPTVHRSRLQERDGEAFMQMTEVDGEPNSETHIRVLSAWIDAKHGPVAHLELTPITGRKHQLRAHCCALDCPIIGDRIYPQLWPEPPLDAPPDFLNPLQLLAREVSFVDPVDGQLRRFTSALQLDLAVRHR